MANKPTLLDRWGRPVKRTELKREVAAATVGGVRSPISGTPGDGLDPVRLANILRAADQGDPVQYLELAEVMEERDLHYLGVLGTRRRSVSQIDITVKPASDDANDIKMAEMVSSWLERDELASEMFDILDCIGKGVSYTEIMWDTSEGQWVPDRLEWRDPRWFRFDRHNLTTPMLLDDNGQETPLQPFKFIQAHIKAKSGLPIRSGLARAVGWSYLFKKFSEKDWAIFSQTYGQPLRVGKWGAGATEDDKDTLFRAVANIAGDCAAIIPESMMIDFIESKNVGPGSDLYEKRCDFLDKQVSKAVLGQTATTDAVTGGLGSGKEHREVQEDIEKADAKALAGILNRDLIRPWIDLEFGPQKAYPTLKIARAEAEDLVALARSLEILVPLGVRVGEQDIRDRFNIPEPKPDALILGRTAPADPNVPDAAPQSSQIGPESSIKYPFNTRLALNRADAAETGSDAPQGRSGDFSPEEDITARLLDEAQPQMAAMLETIETMMETATSLDELRAMLLAAYPDIDSAGFANILASGMMAAHAGGRAEALDDSA